MFIQKYNKTILTVLILIELIILSTVEIVFFIHVQRCGYTMFFYDVDRSLQMGFICFFVVILCVSDGTGLYNDSMRHKIITSEKTITHYYALLVVMMGLN